MLLMHPSHITLALLCVLPLAITNFQMMHIRIINGIESVVNRHILAPRSLNETSFIGGEKFTKRWDGSPAYIEWQPACNRGCTLAGMLNSDDATAGKFLVPPRARAHSDFLDVDGTMPRRGISTSFSSLIECRSQTLGLHYQDPT